MPKVDLERAHRVFKRLIIEVLLADLFRTNVHMEEPESSSKIPARYRPITQAKHIVVAIRMTKVVLETFDENINHGSRMFYS